MKLGPSQASTPRLGYVPALDGVRAVAVIAVLAFHSDLPWAVGGYLGVSVFFTLSGFLITTLLLDEHRLTGRIALGDFYHRRVRRLVPAATVTVGAVLAMWPLWSQAQQRRLPGDALAAVANVANWRAAFAEQASYADLFTSAPSPLAHFWSLAIEEQCYVVLPLVVAGCLRWWGRRAALMVLGAMAALSAVALVMTSDFDIAYNGTHTRAFELLAGAVLAATPWRRLAARRWVGHVGWPALAGLLVLMGSAGLDTPWVYSVGLLVVAGLSTVVVASCVAGGSLAAALGIRPLVAIGRISYGVYLYHWPVFLAVGSTSLQGPALHAVRLSITAAVAWMSARWLESPIRSVDVRRVRWRVVGGAWAAALSLTLAGTLVAHAAVIRMPAAAEPRSPGLQVLGDDPSTAAPLSTPPSATPVVTPVVTPPPAPLRVLALGSEPLGWADTSTLVVTDAVDPGCPVAEAVEVLVGDAVRAVPDCVPAVEAWPQAIAAQPPDQMPELIVLSLGAVDEGVPRASTEVGLPDPRTDATAAADRLRRRSADVAAALDAVVAAGVPVVAVWHSDANSTVLRELVLFDMASERFAGVASDPLAGRQLVDRTAAELRVGSAGQAPVRVLVIGDSTSERVATALHLASTDDAGRQQMVVAWSGEPGCPFVRTAQLRSDLGGDWTTDFCRGWEAIAEEDVAAFRPDVVLVVIGPMELSAQRYPGDDTWYLPGSDGYQRAHDEAMAGFVALLGPEITVMVADSPPIRPGGFATEAMVAPERLAALNAQIDRWVTDHDSVVALSYVDPLSAYEEASGWIRTDGIHADVGPLTEIARASLVPQILDAAG